MSYIEKYFKELELKARLLSKDDIADYLLNQWYYPDRFVLPPCFCVKNFKCKRKPIHLFPPFITKSKFRKPSWKETEKVIFPKSTIMDRVFWVIHPDIYHDLSYYISHNWDEIVNVLFKKRKIYCYSFPIPTENNLTFVTRIKRTERLIYEYKD